MFFHPTCRAGNNLYTLGPRLQIVAVGCLWRRKFNGNIGRCKGLALKLLLVVNINDTHNLMAAAQGYLFYHLTHFAVAD